MVHRTLKGVLSLPPPVIIASLSLKHLAVESAIISSSFSNSFRSTDAPLLMTDSERGASMLTTVGLVRGMHQYGVAVRTIRRRSQSCIAPPDRQATPDDDRPPADRAAIPGDESG